MELEKILRVAVWIAFIMLAFLSVNYKYDACNVCKLDYEGQTLDGPQFMNVYSENCLKKDFVDPRFADFKSVNITFVNP